MAYAAPDWIIDLETIARVLDIIADVVLYTSFFIAALLALRVLLAWMGSNPFGWLPYNLTRLTEPLVRPLRYPFSGRYVRFDLIPLVAGVLVLMNGLFISSVLSQLAAIMIALHGSARYGGWRGPVSESIKLLGLLYVVAIFLRFFLPYFGIGSRSRFSGFLYAITEPVLRPLRKPLRRFLGATPFDFAALVAVFIVWVVTGLLADLAWKIM